MVRNTEYTNHSIHWFLYDESQREFKAQQFGVHATIVQAIKLATTSKLLIHTSVIFNISMTRLDIDGTRWN